MFPSPEQQDVLNSPHRLTIVHAVPGSGKTTVFAELFLSKIKELKGTKKKVAALSFTTSASKEIESRMNESSEHFIGTIDSFLFNYVIKPFGVLIGLPSKGVSIIPSPLDEEMRSYVVRIGTTAQDDISIFKLRFIGGTIDSPQFEYNAKYTTETVSGQYIPAVLRVKETVWNRTGRLTHSDCQYLAAKLLSHEQFGPIVLNVISTKFPWILVDEFQDTGHFLYISLKKFLECAQIRSLVVGDPDQAIFEFSGANPANFNDLRRIENAHALPISTTRRFPQNICHFASRFTENATTINAADQMLVGRVCVVPYNTAEVELSEHLINALREEQITFEQTLILSRRTSDLKRLKGDNLPSSYQPKSLAPRAIKLAIDLFKKGKTNEAFRILSRTISNLIWDVEIINPADRPELDWIGWKKKLFSLLLNLDSAQEGESWNQWVGRSKILVTELSRTYDVTKAYGSSFKTDRANGGELRAATQVTAQGTNHLSTFLFKNIHEAKGTEAETVIWTIPKQTAARCVFNTCFGPRPDLEELRVAFVAITRAKKNLVLLMHQESLNRLRTLKPELNELYEILTIE